LLAVLLTWAAVLYRLPSARRQSRPAARFTWLALLLLAAGITLLLPSVYAAIDAALGVANLTRPLAHACVVGASWSALAVLYHLNFDASTAVKRVRRAGWLAVLAIGLLFALFAVSGATTEETVAFTDRYADQLSVVVYRLVFLAYVGVMLADVVRLSWRYAGLSRSHPALHLGMSLVAVGGLFGLGYVAHGILYLTNRHVPWGYPVPDVPASTMLGAASVSLVVLGVTLPAWGSRFIPSVYRWFREYAACRRLYPLWRDLCRVVPEIALTPVPSAVADTLDVRDVTFRVCRRVVEIRDGRLALSTRVPPATAEWADALAHAAGLTGDQRRAVVEASCLRAALHTRQTLEEPPARSAMPPTIAATALADEIAFLELVADAYQHSPIVQASSRNDSGAAALLACRGHVRLP
jgi:hypothetical protein